MTIVDGEPGAFGVVRFEEVLDVAGVAAREDEVGAPVRADGAGHTADHHEGGDPGADDDPAMAHAGARETFEHERDRTQAPSGDV